LTSQVAANNGYRVEPSDSDTRVMNFLRSKIKHVIYVLKENRPFDQILVPMAILRWLCSANP
jgi:hypothetical protein